MSSTALYPEAGRPAALSWAGRPELRYGVADDTDEEMEDIFLDPKDLPVMSPIRKIRRGRGGDRRPKQFKKDRRERIRAIRRGKGGRKK